MTRFSKLKEKIEQKPTNKNISLEEIRRYLLHYGYRLDRITGSHHIFRNNDGISLTIPVHNNKIKYCYIEKVTKEINKEN